MYLTIQSMMSLYQMHEVCHVYYIEMCSTFVVFENIIALKMFDNEIQVLCKAWCSEQARWFLHIIDSIKVI